MSGGSYDYASRHFTDLARRVRAVANDEGIKRRALRRAFAKLLDRVAEAAHAIEWADSGDTDFEADAVPVLQALLSPRWEIEAAVAHAREAQAELDEAILRSTKEVMP
jgi:hypothetical protein